MSKGNGILRFLNFIVKIGDDRMMYNNIKKDPELRKISTHFGWTSIMYSLLFLACGGGGGVLTYYSFTHNMGIILNIFGIVLGIGLVLFSLEAFYFALSHAIKQMVINRRFVSWLALIVFVISTVATAVIIFMALKSIDKTLAPGGMGS